MIGSTNVKVNTLPALRVGDTGIHAKCCGPNTWIAVAGSKTVFINNSLAHRPGDRDQHCGGAGFMVQGRRVRNRVGLRRRVAADRLQGLVAPAPLQGLQHLRRIDSHRLDHRRIYAELLQR